MILYCLISLMLLKVEFIVSTINDASDLDCTFEFPCHWFNGTTGLEDSLDWSTAQSVTLGTWNNLPILGLSNASTGSCIDDQMKVNKAPKLAFSSDCAESQSLTFMATTKSEADVYAYVTGSSGSTAWLVSDVVPKQIGAGVLMFSYWKSKNSPSLRVCGRKPPGYPNALDCNWYSTNEFHGQQWVKDRVIVPPSNSPFEIIFVAQVADKNNLISIDDIQYRASMGSEDNLAVLQSSRSQQVVGGPTEVRIPRVGDNGQQLADLSAVPTDTSSRKSKNPSSSGFTLAKNVRDTFKIMIDATKCPLVACDFDANLCKYTNVAAGLWRQGKTRVGNRVTGITGDQNGDGGFASVTQGAQSDLSFAISTRPFLTAVPGSLSFAYHISGATSRLRLCDRTLDDCTLIAENTVASASKNLGWQTGELPLAAGSHQLIFIVDRVPPNHTVGLDNIQLWDKTKTMELECCMGYDYL